MADIDSFTSYVQSKINDVMSAASAAEDDLTSIASGLLESFEFSAIPDYDDSTVMVNYTPANVTMDAVAPYAAPDAPGDIDLTPPAAEAIDPIDYTRADAAMAQFNAQQFDPSSIDGEIADLAEKVVDLMDTGGPGVSDAVQSALWSANRARRQQSLDDVLLRVRTSDATSGFPFPTSISDAAEAEHRKKYQDDDDTLNTTITALMTERAHQTAMNALNAGVSLTQIKSNLKEGAYKLYYAMQALILDQFKTLVGAEETRVKTELEKILGDYDVYKTRALTESGVKLDRFKVESSGEETRVRSETALAVAKAEVGLKSNDNLLTAATAEARVQVEKWLATVNNLTDRGKANIGQIMSANEKRVAGAVSQAEYYKGIIIGLTQMVNTLQHKKVP